MDSAFANGSRHFQLEGRETLNLVWSGPESRLLDVDSVYSNHDFSINLFIKHNIPKSKDMPLGVWKKIPWGHYLNVPVGPNITTVFVEGKVSGGDLDKIRRKMKFLSSHRFFMNIKEMRNEYTLRNFFLPSAVAMETVEANGFHSSNETPTRGDGISLLRTAKCVGSRLRRGFVEAKDKIMPRKGLWGKLKTGGKRTLIFNKGH